MRKIRPLYIIAVSLVVIKCFHQFSSNLYGEIKLTHKNHNQNIVTEVLFKAYENSFIFVFYLVTKAYTETSLWMFFSAMVLDQDNYVQFHT